MGYAITSYRAQGITTDTAHVLIHAAMTRENLYVALTRGRERNMAYVAVDKPDPAHEGAHPGDNPEATGRSVLFGVLQHIGAELSAHETISAEQEAWSSIAQLAAEYETIAAAAQHDRWVTLIRASGLTDEKAEDAIASDAFGALAVELRRAEANRHDIGALLPRLVAARGFADADDIAALLHHRLAMATARPAGSGRTRKPPRLIAGLIPEAAGAMSPDMRQAFTGRRDLIETRADAILDQALTEHKTRTTALGTPPSDNRAAAEWRRYARTAAAYRDRYSIIDPAPLGAPAESTAQKIDAARARTALDRARRLADTEQQTQEPSRRRGPERIGRTL
ncbi:hypothetical protein DUY81_09385 [Acidipropionibacterium acidipropionici]|uniref:Uncharacterized protein n=1 Tax=Acidipropionibacterium acidipropionici TaxID=1748 RepID=A0AAC8YCW8_9ACTN|nr:helicase C-terminal domain-containing protein [Acidipropionibacterium acidipropionici]AMS04501.1 hypothetical protein AXH35_02405 [Acidipropionibacterium acidipropionici]AOZ45994.1 hypothetical protein A8L58_03870 [Acidipropionibacterium acidipropionici]AZP37984.1 hypothetical protein DUY81_09385 [Acidipropionibacterium acidipropionici]